MQTSPAVRKSEGLLYLTAACLGAIVCSTAVGAALGVGIRWWVWVAVVVNCAGFSSTVLRKTRPTTSAYLLVAAAALSVGSTLFLVSRLL